MGRMRIAFFAVLLAVLGSILPARAAAACSLTPASGRRFIDIQVLEQGFVPFTQQAFAGDVIRWKVGGSSRHIILPYAPKNVPGFGQSQELQPGDVHCITFGGGSVWYRDGKGQTSVVEASGVCHGRCASISDRTADPVPPSITPPSGPSTTRPTEVKGTSEPLTLVKLAALPAGETAYDAGSPIGAALADETGAWTAQLDLDGGTHNLAGRAVDAAGRESEDSTSTGSPVAIEVVKDSEPPALTASQPTPPVLLAGTKVTGAATDNGRVTQVVVVVSDIRNGQLLLGDSGRATTIISKFDVCAPDPCAPGTYPWTFTLAPVSRIVATIPGQAQPTVIGLATGIYTVRIIAYDAWLNASAPVEFNVAVVAPPRIG